MSFTSDLETHQIDLDEATGYLQKEGSLAATFPDYEVRPQQQEMLRDIAKGFNENQIVLIEAGTGTGKSLAYLIPSLLWALRRGDRIVISTNTINLQEQLLLKDIPLLKTIIKAPIPAVLVKGMGNYLCLRKFEESKLELPLMTPEEQEEWGKLDRWRQSTQDGSRTDVPFIPSAMLWEKSGAEHDTCTKRQCPRYKECFFFKARKKAEEAKLLIVNHHLLCSDLVARRESDEEGVLPDYRKVIVDEAHNLEEIATDFFAGRFVQLGFLKNLGRLSAEKQGKHTGKLPVLKYLLSIHFRNGLPEEHKNIHHWLAQELPAARNRIVECLYKMCDALQEFCALFHVKKGEDDQIRIRLQLPQKSHPLWLETVVPSARAFVGETAAYAQMLFSLDKSVGRLSNEKFSEQAKGVLADITALADRISSSAAVVKQFIDPELPSNKVQWVEIQALRSGSQVLLSEAELDISKPMSELLFNNFDSTVMVSATMTSAQTFTFIRSRLGLNETLLPKKEIVEKIYDSPFDYRNQALIVMPNDLPDPHEAHFNAACAEHIWQAIQASRGNAFVLFTSYSALKNCYDRIAGRLEQHRYTAFKQGDASRKTLLDHFKATDHSVLFGTDSFWEGVDVAGDALRCVIIAKLPFKVPTEPIIQARCEAISAKGEDSFSTYSLPLAVVKFKQGFGRLIRNRKDRGCVVCLDRRLLTKGYGKEFLKSLPPCQQISGPSDHVYPAMEKFYRRQRII